MSTLGEYMALAGMTDAALAEKVECDRAYITKIRNGRREPSLKLAARLERVTGLPAAAFLKSRAA